MKRYFLLLGRAASAALFVVAALFLAIMVLRLGGNSDYDMQALAKVAATIIIWFLIVVGYARIKALVEEDDLVQDWLRINDGNVAVAIYRGLELFGVSIAAALLITKI